MGKKNNNKQTCVTFLTREQIDYLDKIGKDHLFKYGNKLSRSEILSDLVNLAMKLGIEVEKIKLHDNESLLDGILRTIK